MLEKLKRLPAAVLGPGLPVAGVLLIYALAGIVLSFIASSGESIAFDWTILIFLTLIAMLLVIFLYDWAIAKLRYRFGWTGDHSPATTPRQWRIIVATAVAFLAGTVFLMLSVTRCCGSIARARDLILINSDRFHVGVIVIILLFVALSYLIVRRKRFSYLFVAFAISAAGILVPSSWIVWSWSTGLSEANLESQAFRDDAENLKNELIEAYLENLERTASRDQLNQFLAKSNEEKGEAVIFYYLLRAGFGTDAEQFEAKQKIKRLELAAAAHDQSQQDYNQLRKRQILGPWVFVVFWALGICFVSMMLLHLCQRAPFSPGYLRRQSNIALGYSLLLYAFTPFILVAVLATATVNFGGRLSVSADNLVNDVEIIANDVRHDIHMFREFAEREQQTIAGIFEGIRRLEGKIAKEVFAEIAVVKNEVIADYKIAKTAIVDLEKEAEEAVKESISAVTSKITDAFSFDIPFLGNIDLGIGKFLSNLIPNFNIKEKIQELGTKMVTKLQQPFLEPMRRIRALENEIGDLITKERDAVVRLIQTDVKVIRGDIQYITNEIKHAQDEFKHDLKHFVDEVGTLIHHILWYVNIVALVLVTVLIYLLIGFFLNFWMRLNRAFNLLAQN